MRSYRYLVVTFLSAFLVLWLIYHFGNIPNRHNNGFRRSYIPHAWSAVHEIRLQDTTYDIVGATPWNIYVAATAPGEVFEVGRDLQHTIRRIKIPFFGKYYDSLQFSSLSIKVDSPRIYLFAENKPAIIKTNFDSSVFDIRILPPGAFTREAMADTDCFILRKLNPAIADQQFVWYSFGTGQLKKEDNISPVYGDGGIVTDGQLHFDAVTHTLCYIYYYRNLLLSFDTSFHSVNKFFSVDTARSFVIKTGLVTNDGIKAYTNITPANMINKLNFVAGGLSIQYVRVEGG
jgi:hypothetical protein